MSDNRFARIQRIFIGLLAAWMIFNLVGTLQYVIADYSQLPVADYWRVPLMWPGYKAFRFAGLWRQHNEHRIVFPELIYMADMLLLRGRMYLPIAIGGVCYLGVWFALVWAAYSQKSMKPPAREAALLVAGVLIVWKGCSTVIATPFQLSFTLVQFVSVAALALLAKLAETGRVKYLAGVIAAAAIGTYSSGSGMLLWPVLLAGAFVLHANRRHVLILSAAAVLFAGAYFIDYRFMPSAIGVNLKHPLQELAFFCSYLSMPFGSFWAPSFGITIGALNLSLMAFCFVSAWRRGWLTTRLGTLVFGTYLFILLSALLTAAGRMDLNDYSFVQAKQWRYVTMPTVGWALFAIALIWLAEVKRSQAWALLTAFLLVAFSGYGFVKARYWLEGTRADSQHGQIVAAMLRANVFDPDQARTIFPDPEFVRTYSKQLKEDGKSIWAEGLDPWMGRNIAQLHPSQSPISGQITRVYPVPGGLEILGWADTSSLTDDRAVLFVDEDNRIVGFGNRPAAGMPGNLTAWHTPNMLAFVGFVPTEKAAAQLSVYVRTAHGRNLQLLAGKVEIPAFTAIENSSDFVDLADITWQPDTNWTVNGYPSSSVHPTSPGKLIYGSWSGADANTGAIRTKPFATPPNHRLVLPVLHGDSTYGQSVEVRDADTGQSIASLPMMDGQSAWKRWLIKIPDKTRKVVIAADDRGSGPSQWVALATPERNQ